MKRKLKSDRKYKEWMWVKDETQARGAKRSFKEWQIWWCSIGENVGIEINGKGDIAKIERGFKKLYAPEKIRPRLLWGRVGKSQTYLHYKRFLKKMQGFWPRRKHSIE